MEISISHTIPDGFLYKSKSLRQQTTKELVTSMKAAKDILISLPLYLILFCTYSFITFFVLALCISYAYVVAHFFDV